MTLTVNVSNPLRERAESIACNKPITVVNGDQFEFAVALAEVSLAKADHHLYVTVKQTKQVVTLTDFFKQSSCTIQFSDNNFTINQLEALMAFSLWVEPWQGEAYRVQLISSSVIDVALGDKVTVENSDLNSTNGFRNGSDLTIQDSNNDTHIILSNFFMMATDARPASQFIFQGGNTTGKVDVILGDGGDIMPLKAKLLNLAIEDSIYGQYFRFSPKENAQASIIAKLNNKALPGWLTLASLEDGANFLSGIPQKGDAGSYEIQLIATINMDDSTFTTIESYPFIVKLKGSVDDDASLLMYGSLGKGYSGMNSVTLSEAYRVETSGNADAAMSALPVAAVVASIDVSHITTNLDQARFTGSSSVASDADQASSDDHSKVRIGTIYGDGTTGGDAFSGFLSTDVLGPKKGSYDDAVEQGLVNPDNAAEQSALTGYQLDGVFTPENIRSVETSDPNSGDPVDSTVDANDSTTDPTDPVDTTETPTEVTTSTEIPILLPPVFVLQPPITVTVTFIGVPVSNPPIFIETNTLPVIVTEELQFPGPVPVVTNQVSFVEGNGSLFYSSDGNIIVSDSDGDIVQAIGFTPPSSTEVIWTNSVDDQITDPGLTSLIPDVISSFGIAIFNPGDVLLGRSEIGTTWTYNNELNLDFLGDGEELTWTYNINAIDDRGGVGNTNTGIDPGLTFIVKGVNDAPIANNDNNWVAEGELVDTAEGNVLVSQDHGLPPPAVTQEGDRFEDVADTDLDATDILSVTRFFHVPDEKGADLSNPGTLGSPLMGLFGTLTLYANGAYAYTIDNTNPDISSLERYDRRSDEFEYEITDSNGDSTTARLEFTILGTDEAIPGVGQFILWTPNYNNLVETDPFQIIRDDALGGFEYFAPFDPNPFDDDFSIVNHPVDIFPGPLGHTINMNGLLANIIYSGDGDDTVIGNSPGDGMFEPSTSTTFNSADGDGIFTSGGDDIIDGGNDPFSGGGPDYIDAGEGNDQVAFYDNTTYATGGSGYDSISIDVSATELDLSVGQYRNFEQVLETPSHNVTVTIDYDAVLSTDDNELFIDGDSGDSVELTEQWGDPGPTTTVGTGNKDGTSGTEYNIYSAEDPVTTETVTLYVSTDIDDVEQPPLV